jgi:hypothetical protein
VLENTTTKVVVVVVVVIVAVVVVVLEQWAYSIVRCSRSISFISLDLSLNSYSRIIPIYMAVRCDAI